MLIGFIGAPCSGKTTTAALVFAALKQMNKIVEFVPECARAYICKKREEEGNTFTLDNYDQVDICLLQKYYEDLFLNSGNDVIVLTDSSTYNAFLYMTPDWRFNPIFSNVDKREYDYLFHCPPVIPYSTIKDPNRLHDYNTSLEIEKSIPEIIKHPYITITGDAQTRADKIIRILLGYDKC
jgi:hypothetical protein